MKLNGATDVVAELEGIVPCPVCGVPLQVAGTPAHMKLTPAAREHLTGHPGLRVMERA